MSLKSGIIYQGDSIMTTATKTKSKPAKAAKAAATKPGSGGSKNAPKKAASSGRKSREQPYDGSTPLDSSRHEEFVHLLVYELMPKVRAYKRAVSSSVTYGAAAVLANRLLKKDNIRRRFNYLRDEEAKRIQEQGIISKTETMQVLADIIKASHADIMVAGPDGAHMLDLEDISACRAVEGLKTKTVYDEHGNNITQTLVTDVKLSDRVRAAKLLAEMQEGWLAPRNTNLSADDSLGDMLLALAGDPKRLPSEE